MLTCAVEGAHAATGVAASGLTGGPGLGAAVAPEVAVLSAGIAASLLATLLMVIVFAHFARLTRERHLLWWTAAWGFMLARRVSELVTLHAGAHPITSTAFDFAMIAASLFIAMGASQLRGRRVSAWFWAGGVLAVLAQALGRALGLPFWAATLPPFAFMASVLIYSGVIVLRTARARSLGRALGGWGLVLWGIHVLDYPFLRPVPEAARWSYLLAAVLQIAIAVGLVLVHVDRVRDALVESERRFRSFFTHSVDGLFRADGAGRLLTLNPALVGFLGAASLEEAHGRVRLEDLLPGGLPGQTQPRLGVVDEARPFFTYLRPDGTTIDLQVTAWRVRDELGEPCGIEGTVRDVTREVALQARQLQASKLEAVGQLAGGVAHDFNNLLTIVLGCASLLERATPEEQPPLLRDLTAAAQQAADLTARLLTFSRQRAIEARALDLGPIVRDLAPLLGRLLGPDRRLALALCDAPCVVNGEAGLVEQILLNLVVNARDAMGPGGTVTVRLVVEGATVVLSVADDGHGIPAEVLPHIFEPFFTTKGVGGGHGLGLATVYGAVSQLSGSIDVESEVGAGATFVVRLPARPRTDPSAQALPPRRVSLRRGRVLLADPDAATARFVEHALGGLGHEVIAHADGEEAWTAFAAAPERFDLVVADVALPGLSGPALAGRIRATRPGIPVIFTSGAGERRPGATEAERLLGPHLRKPLTSETLIEGVERALAATA